MGNRSLNKVKGKVIYNWPSGYCEEKFRFYDPLQLGKEPFDVAIIGAGVVGCALAYRLSQYDLSVIIIDKNADVGAGTSKANSAIISTGYDATPGSLEAELVKSSADMWPEMAKKLKLPYNEVSALILAMDDEQLNRLPELLKDSEKNGIYDVEIISGDKVKTLEPNISDSIKGALHVKRESITDPFAACIAYGEVAVVNGATFVLGFNVASIKGSGKGVKTISSKDDKTIQANIVINASGLQSAVLSNTYNGKHYDINPRRGQFIIYDKACGDLVNRILMPVPSPIGKGILVTPTIFGNLLAGPTAEDLPSSEIFSTNTTLKGIEKVKRETKKICPSLPLQLPIATYAGLRANCAQGCYRIEFNDGEKGIITINGIRSTGLTAGLGIADYVLKNMQSKCGLNLIRKPDAKDSRPDSDYPKWADPRPFENKMVLEKNKDYGAMVCFCEQISRQEIIDAIRSPLIPRTIDSIKRRTRSAMGRCQGFNCRTVIAELISQECNIPFHQVNKKGPYFEESLINN
jgi:glycerol-3-phosphate dehydrogenase